MRLLTGAAAVALALACAISAEAAKTPRPNIVVILADDMGYADAGCFGGEIRTPTIDRLAANGLRFTQFYNMSRCCPTRASLLTGLYPHQAGLGHMTWKKMDLPGYRADLSHDTPTIAELLRQAPVGTQPAAAEVGRGGAQGLGGAVHGGLRVADRPHGRGDREDCRRPDLSGSAWELYDMEADRTEMHDLSAEHPDRVKELSAA